MTELDTMLLNLDCHRHFACSNFTEDLAPYSQRGRLWDRYSSRVKNHYLIEADEDWLKSVR